MCDLKYVDREAVWVGAWHDNDFLSAGIGMLLLFDAKGTPFVKELVRDGAADVDGTIHVGDQVRDQSNHVSKGRTAEK